MQTIQILKDSDDSLVTNNNAVKSKVLTNLFWQLLKHDDGIL